MTVKSSSVPEADTEVWRTIPGYSAYSASSLGRIRRETGSRVAVAGYVKTLSQDGRYGITRLYTDDGVLHSRRVHILVALAFLGPKPTPAHEVNHRNGDKLDNRPENLEYISSDENEAHAARNRLKRWGEEHPMRKLTADNVRTIRSTPRLQGELARRFGVSTSTIQAVRSGKTWRHLDEEPTETARIPDGKNT